MPITTKFKQQLKAHAHGLKPIVFIGHAGYTDNVKNEIDQGLEIHELIKIRIHEGDRDMKRQLFAEICESVNAVPVQLIGGIGILYRKSDKSN